MFFTINVYSFYFKKSFKLFKIQIGVLYDLYSMGNWHEGLCGNGNRSKLELGKKSLRPTSSRLSVGFMPFNNKVLNDL